MDLRQLRYFLKVAESGSFHRAASALNVSQSALGLHVRNLEAELQTSLLHRHSRGVVLTDAGRLMASHAAEIFAILDHARREVLDETQAPPLHLRIGFSPALAGRFGPSFLARCASVHPHLSASLLEAPSALLPRLVKEGALDLACGFEFDEAQGLAGRRLGEEALVLVTQADTDAAPVEFAQACALPLLLPPREHGLRRLIDTTAKRLGIRISIRAEIQSMQAALALIGADGAAAIWPRSASGALPAGLSFRPIADPVLTRPLWAFAAADAFAGSSAAIGILADLAAS